MCRLCMMNRPGLDLIEKRMGLEEFFDYLEWLQGGHGNGVAVSSGGRVWIRKGVMFTTKEAADFLRGHRFEWALFHTRLASVGSISDKHCHPFRCGDTVLAMNGTELGVRSMADLMGVTDTEAILILLSRLGYPIPASLKKFQSVFMGFKKGKPFVVSCGWGDLEVVRKGPAIVFSSSFPATWEDVYTVASRRDFIWTGGRLPEERLEPWDLSQVGRYGRYGYYRYGENLQDWDETIAVSSSRAFRPVSRCVGEE